MSVDDKAKILADHILDQEPEVLEKVKKILKEKKDEE